MANENYNFSFEVSTAAANEMLTDAEDFDLYLKNAEEKELIINKNLAQYLNSLMVKKGIDTCAQIAHECRMDYGKYVYDIFNGKKNPSRDKLIAITIGMHLSEKETQRALKIAGHSELYSRKKRDAAILWAIRHEMNFDATNDLLADHDLEML